MGGTFEEISEILKANLNDMVKFQVKLNTNEASKQGTDIDLAAAFKKAPLRRDKIILKEDAPAVEIKPNKLLNVIKGSLNKSLQQNMIRTLFLGNYETAKTDNFNKQMPLLKLKAI